MKMLTKHLLLNANSRRVSIAPMVDAEINSIRVCSSSRKSCHSSLARTKAIIARRTKKSSTNSKAKKIKRNEKQNSCVALPNKTSSLQTSSTATAVFAPILVLPINGVIVRVTRATAISGLPKCSKTTRFTHRFAAAAKDSLLSRPTKRRQTLQKWFAKQAIPAVTRTSVRCSVSSVSASAKPSTRCAPTRRR